MATNNPGNLPTGASGTILRGGGVGSASAFSTATYPSTAGTSGNVLTSDGTNFVSSAAAATTGYVLSVWAAPGNPADGLTYYLQTGQVVTNTQTSTSAQRFPVPKTGTLTTAYGTIRAATPGSGESITITFLINDAGATSITTTAVASSAENTFSNTGLSSAVTAGDYITFRMVCPTWSSNPLNLSIAISVIII